MFKENNIPWNKGKKNPYSQETRQKMSESGKKRIDIVENFIPFKFKKGHSPWNKNKENVYTTERLKQISEAAKLRRGIKNPFYGKKHSAESIEKMQKPRGGVTPLRTILNGRPEYKQWRKSVFERDHYTCLICGNVGGYLQAHHIKLFSKYPESRYDVNNGITMCKACHYIQHRGKR